MTLLTRRRSLTLLAGLVAAAEFGCPSAEAATETFVAFGDSYTRSYRAGIPTWADQINASGAARMLVDLAASGSFAAGSNAATTLDGQVDRWIGSYKSRGVPDRTVIYMGNNDVAFGGSLTTAMNQYRAQVDRLIANRVTYGSRRLVLCLLHDWSRNPSSTTSVRSRVRWWNDHLASIAAARPNVVTVNLFARYEDVLAHPAKYGLVNVTSPNKSLSATTYLYFDGNHFGRKGHAIIAKEVVPKLQ